MGHEGRTFRVLSVDGGGMRGIYTAAYLDSLARRYAISRGVEGLDVGAGFDLITGTSTGGIVACALAAGVPLDQVMKLYRERGHEIFPAKLPKNLGARLIQQILVRHRYLRAGANALQEALQRELGDMTVGDLWKSRQIALAIPAVDMSRHRSWVFKTPHVPGTKHRDDGYTLASVCLATTAAPIYRSMARIENPDTHGHRTFVDGGLWANNPVMVGLIDALEMTGRNDRIEIYCLGTCPRPEGELLDDSAVHRGLLGWRFGGEAISLAIGAQEYAFDNMARMLAKHVDRDCKLVRFPQGKVPAQMMQHLDLDETSEEAMAALTGQAQTDVDETLAQCRDTSSQTGQMLNRLLNDLPVARKMS
jgi:hypothetical protein